MRDRGLEILRSSVLFDALLLLLLLLFKADDWFYARLFLFLGVCINGVVLEDVGNRVGDIGVKRVREVSRCGFCRRVVLGVLGKRGLCGNTSIVFLFFCFFTL